MDFLRDKRGFPYSFEGVKLNSLPNAIPPNKSPYAQNIRSLGGTSIRVRPGQSLRFSTGVPPITDLRAYAALSTDNFPRILARSSADAIWLDNGTQVGSLVAGGPGATFIPFRPNQSPQPWLYIANGADFQKFSSPSPSVVQRKVGIAEPQVSPTTVPDQLNVFEFTSNAASWTAASTAGALSDQTRTADTAVAFFADPASQSPPGLSIRYSMRVGTAIQYQTGMAITVVNTGAGGSPVPMIIQDVLPPVASNSSLSIQAINYFIGTTGRAVIVPSQMPIDNSIPEFGGLNPIGNSLNAQALLGGLRRGSLIQLGTGGNTEIVFVTNVTHGPQGLIAFECLTMNTHVAGETMLGIPAVSVSFNQAPAGLTGQAISATAVQSSITTGTGTISKTISAANNPFTRQPFVPNPLLPTAQQDDYVHLSVQVSDLTLLTSIRLLFDVGDGSFTQNYLYYDVQPSALVSAAAGTQTQLGAAQTAAQQAQIRQSIDQGVAPTINPESSRLPGLENALDLGININTSGTTDLGASQWSEIMFPITNFTRVGNDESKTLANTNAVRIQAIVTGTITLQFSSIWVESGGQPDVGDVGALYLYRVRPRDSRTGVVGNPSPPTRYGISPRRQQVVVQLPSSAYDPQIDTWDVFRYGGSVTSWRYIGSTLSSNTTFIDNVFDSEAQVGDPLDFDNFEPWPTIDLPQNLVATVVGGTIALVTIPAPTNALNWLPGTQVQLAGGQVFTLRLRPVLISGTTYRLEFVECAIVGTNVMTSIPEPILGNQKQPYMFGPDANGRVIGVGDPLRPGTFSYCKSNNLDSVPDTYNRELTPPSEPLIGGEIIDGRGFLASPERWWELIPQQSDDPTQFYNPVQSPLPRGLAAPFGHCNDGVNFYWWAKDGIYSSTAGSLTDADLYSLFPHEGETGQGPIPGAASTYGGFVIQPPDYKRTGTFRLTHSNGFLYATYQDASGIYRTLTCDLHHGNAWIPDVYSPAVTVFYHPEQQAGTVLASTNRYDETVMGLVDGRVAAQAALTNDLNAAIACAHASFEFDGGDIRAPVQWGDYFVDLIAAAAPAGVLLSPMSASVGVGTPSTILTSALRQRIPVSIGGLVVSDFMGLLATWSEDFTQQSTQTVLNLWQPSFDLQPARGIAWQTFGSSFGISGFGHIPWIEVAWVSTQPVTLTITCFDGTSPAPIVIPSSGGVYQKALFRLTFNKGRLYAFAAASAAPFQFFMDDWDIMWGAWGRTDQYQNLKTLGVPNVEQSPV